MVGTIITMAFVFAILAIAAYALFEITPVRAPHRPLSRARRATAKPPPRLTK